MWLDDDITVPKIEAIALWNGLLLANRKDIRNLHVEGDSKFVINSLCNLERHPWNIYSILNNFHRIIYFR